MPLERKPTGAYDAAYPVNVPGGGTAYANATVAVDQNGNPISGGSGGAVTIADGADVAEGATTAAAYTDQTGAASGTVVGLLKGVYAALRGTLATTGTVVGNVASRATDSGAPVKIGVLVSTATPADATAGQRIDIWGTSKGALVVAAGGLSFNLGDNLGLGTGAFTGILDQGNNGKALVTAGLYYDGTNYSRQRGDTNGSWAVSTASGAAAIGIVPVVASNASSLVVKASAGNFYGGSIVAGATAGFLIAYNAAAAPGAGTTLTPAQMLGVVQVAANGSAALGEYTVPDRFGTGIVLLFSTSTTIYTVPANNAVFLRGRAM